MNGVAAVAISTRFGALIMSSISPASPGHPVGDDASRPDDRSPSLVDWSIPPLLQSGCDAFRRDLPELLKKHEGEWAAYSGDRRLGITRTKSQAFQLGFKEGLTDHEFVVLGITPEIPDDVDWEDFGDI